MPNSSFQDPQRIAVLKFGSSVLRTPADYPAAAHEIYAHVRAGEKVIAVVSALEGETDLLLQQAAEVGSAAPGAQVARLARLGELRSAALMALALDRIGIRAVASDPAEIGLVAEGDPLDSDLSGLDVEAVAAKLARYEALVVPGFTAAHAAHGVATLGRGGSDLSAVFLAGRLGSDKVRLLKDVDGVYSADPESNPDAIRFGRISYEAAAAASSGLIQPKAIEAAKKERIEIEIASVGRGEGTSIGLETSCPEPSSPMRPLRVALLGCGSVGAGVLDLLLARPDLFDVNPVLVRHPERHREHGHAFTADFGEAMQGDPDLVIELIGGADLPAEIMSDALRAGTHVVTANKAAVAAHYERLHASAAAGGAVLAFSAAVGGSVPILEAVNRLASTGEIRSIEGVMNGTSNFLLGKLGEGCDFAQAVAEAQALGFAEADPSADVDGDDAAAKLSILIRLAFGIAVPPQLIPKQSLSRLASDAAAAAWAEGKVLKQVGRCELLPNGLVDAEVTIRTLPVNHPLAAPRNEENCFVLADADGGVHILHGKGAGRWPTTAAVMADVMDVQRRCAEAANQLMQMRLTA